MSSLFVPIVKIEKIEKHPNADTLSIANFEGMGWDCIIKTGDFQVGDLAIYVPIDHVVPEKLIEEYGLAYLKGNGRVTTVKLRQYVSQGLLLDLRGKKFKLGDNVAEKLGIIKWEPPTPGFSQQLGKVNRITRTNSNFTKYTDIQNIKNYFNVFEDGDEVVITEKLHGCNSRFGNLPIDFTFGGFFTKIKNRIKAWYTGGYEFVYGSHNVQLGIAGRKEDLNGNNVWSKIVKKYELNKIIPKDYLVYGEIYGKGIQDLTYGLEDIELAVFDVKYKGEYLSWNEVEEFCKKFGLPTVPVLYKGTYNKDLLPTYTNGKSTICANQIREGCVIKPIKETNHGRVGRKILKSVSETYLMRKGGTEYH